MIIQHMLVVVICLALFFCNAFGVELTFELEDNDKQCFYQDITKDTKGTLEYQVVSGGRYDVDCTLEDPDGLKLYAEKRKQYDSYQWDAQKSGAYKICFSNEFSTISHKVVYFDLTVGSEDPLLETMDRATALSQMETSSVTIHDRLKDVVSFQTHFRLREAHGRIFAEGINSRVQIMISSLNNKCSCTYQKCNCTCRHETFRICQESIENVCLKYTSEIWSIIQLIIMVTVMVGQVYILRSFFSNKHHQAARTDT